MIQNAEEKSIGIQQRVSSLSNPLNKWRETESQIVFHEMHSADERRIDKLDKGSTTSMCNDEKVKYIFQPISL